MRNSKILKCISYALIPFLILIILLSLTYEGLKEEWDVKETLDKNNYFETDSFLSSYMSTLASQSRRLIYDNEKYTTIQDSNYKICYAENQDYYYRNIENYYYIIIYKNLALTNVELTTETNTIEKIKNYIFSQDAKKANIVNGIVEADSELIKTKAIQYFSSFDLSYYTIADNGEYKTYEDVEVIEEIEGTTNISTKNFYNTSIDDFQIYTTYKENLLDSNEDIFFKNLALQLKPYEVQLLYAMPVCCIALFIIFTYLIIAIGHTKGKDGIDLSDLDKIPLEIILFIVGIAVTIILAGFFNLISSVTYEYYEFSISLFIAGYFISYILCAITGITIIKRIKAKIFFKTTITGYIFLLCVRFIKKICSNIKKTYNELLSSTDTSLKIALYIIGYLFVSFLLIICFNVFGLLLALLILAYIYYKFIERVNSYKKIENHLKDMYEGKEVQNLFSSDFTPEFKEVITYINDILNGFENAKEEGIKSERMKTELITNVSHDIKTPLTSIINYVDLLKKENIKNEKAKEYIEVLDGKSQRLKKLLEDLVEASKASSGNLKLDIEKLNIVELIKQASGEFEDRFKNKKLEIIYSMPKELYINADSRYMYRVIENLFSNISKYALDSSRVYIDIKNEGTKVKISFKNISKDKLNISAEELLQRFVRGDKSRTTEGSGLGLSISQSLTELQKGKFTLNIDGDLFKSELEFDIAK